MLTKDEAQARVRSGAAYLDQLYPAWADHININTFDLADCCRCVLGQLHGDYFTAVVDRRIIPRYAWQGPRVAFRRAEALGLDAPDAPLEVERSADFALLQDAWVEAIAERRCHRESVAAVAVVDDPVVAG